MTNTKDETPPSPSDLDGFVGAPPAKKLDDKAAILESQLADLKSSQANERSICLFVISVLICLLVGASMEIHVFYFAVLSAVIINIVISKTIGTPMLASYLEPWNIRLQKAFDKHVLGKSDDEYE